jgi:chromosome segregation ATPase
MFGGFHPQDVVNYIAKKNREYKEELEALRSGADKLRRERDGLITGDPPSSSEPKYASVGSAAQTADSTDELRIQFYAMRRERDELRAKLDTLSFDRESERSAMERFERERSVFEADRSSLFTALTRREEEKAELAKERADLLEENQRLTLLLEQAGATREQIKMEREDAEKRLEDLKTQAVSVRQETARLITESRTFFDDMNEKSRTSALEIVLELDKMRSFFTRFPERFADTGQVLSKLESDPRPFMREFKPQVFSGPDVLPERPRA